MVCHLTGKIISKNEILSFSIVKFINKRAIYLKFLAYKNVDFIYYFVLFLMKNTFKICVIEIDKVIDQCMAYIDALYA
jgi:hypothetical protein